MVRLTHDLIDNQPDKASKVIRKYISHQLLKRNRFRKNNDFVKADEIRNKLESCLKIKIFDTSSGVTWCREFHPTDEEMNEANKNIFGKLNANTR
jgi:cysteinyl-tRNA synthetase